MIERNLPGAQIVYKQICDAGYDPKASVSFMSDAKYSIALVACKAP
jgi:hypothetical protein